MACVLMVVAAVRVVAGAAIAPVGDAVLDKAALSTAHVVQVVRTTSISAIKPLNELQLSQTFSSASISLWLRGQVRTAIEKPSVPQSPNFSGFALISWA